MIALSAFTFLNKIFHYFSIFFLSFCPFHLPKQIGDGIQRKLWNGLTCIEEHIVSDYVQWRKKKDLVDRIFFFFVLFVQSKRNKGSKRDFCISNEKYMSHIVQRRRQFGFASLTGKCFFDVKIIRLKSEKLFYFNSIFDVIFFLFSLLFERIRDTNGNRSE